MDKAEVNDIITKRQGKLWKELNEFSPEEKKILKQIIKDYPKLLHAIGKL